MMNDVITQMITNDATDVSFCRSKTGFEENPLARKGHDDFTIICDVSRWKLIGAALISKKRLIPGAQVSTHPRQLKDPVPLLRSALTSSNSLEMHSVILNFIRSNALHSVKLYISFSSCILTELDRRRLRLND